MIEAVGVSLRYPNGTVALKDVHLRIMPGDMVYITGASGSGKTSLLKLFMGMEFPTEGSLRVLNCPMEKGNSAGIMRLRRMIGPVFQDFRLFKGRTALENVMLGMRFLRPPIGQLKENAQRALAKVGLEHKADSLVENLSWGECQRVSIARAVARRPALILADEPTGNLDRENSMRILELLRSFHDHNTTVVVTTHATHLIHPQKGDLLLQIEGGRIRSERVGKA